jgi:hypothetical protein
MSPATIGFRLWSLLGLETGLARRLAPLGFAIALLAGAGATVALIGGAIELWGWWHARGAVEAATNAANADFRARQVQAERTAGAAKDARDAGDQAAQRDLQEGLDDADDQGASGADAAWNGGLWADPAGAERGR